MIKLYTDTSFLTESNRKQVFPLLFDLWYLKNDNLVNYYQLTDDVVACDVVVLPIDYTSFLKHPEALNRLLQTAKAHRKPLWIYSAGDYGFTNYIPHSYTFRMGGFKSKLPENTFVLPAFINDPYDDYLIQDFGVLNKTSAPQIGFVGHAHGGIKKFAKELLSHLKYVIRRKSGFIKADAQTFYASSIKREKYLSVLSKSPDLKTDFILKPQYRAGAQTEALKQASSQTFFNNIYNNAYTFCSRGVGNFSVRFYEVLAVGRIPVLLDTDCQLPLEPQIDWSQHCVILDARSNKPLATQILEFHERLSPEAFKQLQRDNRALWLQQLERIAYFKHIHHIFNKAVEDVSSF